MAITVKEFTAAAIKEGVEDASYMFMENLENKLRLEVKISEFGNAYDYLQNMINEDAEVDLDLEEEDWFYFLGNVIRIPFFLFLDYNMANSNYEEDLYALSDIINILFDLSFSIYIRELFEKYRDNYSINKNYRAELLEYAKNNSLLVLSHVSERYINENLMKYFSETGIVLYITNEIVSKSTIFYNSLIESVEK